jgi:predicted transcriptional regulator YdeE
MQIRQQEPFFVVGLATRTNNANQTGGKNVIRDIWHTFLSQNLAAKIPNKIGVDLYAVYTDYESDHTGDFTYLLGMPVSSVENLPAGLTIKDIPGGVYSVVTSNKGPVMQVVPEVWRRIWSMPPAELGGTRAFHTDYEIYDQRASDPERTQIDVYIGLR